MLANDGWLNHLVGRLPGRAWWGVAAVVAGVVVAGVALTQPSPEAWDVHTGLALAGTADRAAAVVAAPAPVADLPLTVAWDLLFIVGWAVLLAGVLYGTAADARRTTRARCWAMLGLLAVAAAVVADVGEDVGLLLLGPAAQARSFDGAGAAALLAATWVLAAWKWALLAVAVCLGVALITAARGAGPPRPPGSEVAPEVVSTPHTAGLGVCVSGGGMRSATFTLGALGRLERVGVLGKATWLSAVSGGGYTAAAWWLARHERPADSVLNTPSELSSGGPASPGYPPAGTPSLYAFIRARRRYLSSGRGGFLASVLLGLSIMLAHLTLLYLSVIVLARPLGWLVGSDAVGEEVIEPLRTDSVAGQPTLGSLAQDLARLAWPGAVLAAAAVVVLGLSLRYRGRPQILRRQWGVGLLAAAGSLSLVLVALPAAVAELPFVWSDLAGVISPDPAPAEDATASTVVLQLLGLLGVFGLLTRALARPAGRIAPRAGAALVVLLALVVAAGSLTNAAWLGPQGVPEGGVAYYADPLLLLFPAEWTDVWRWTVAAGMLLLAYVVVNQRWFSLHTVYRVALRNSFAATTRPERAAKYGDQDAGFWPLSARTERESLTWTQLRSGLRQQDPGQQDPGQQDPGQQDPGQQDPGQQGPELLVCASGGRRVARGADDVTRIPAVSFVLSRQEVVWYPPGTTWYLDEHRLSCRTADWTASLPGSSKRGDLATVTTAAAISGAAVASTLGRHSLGTTHSLLAVLNLRLGVWLPNPARVRREAERKFSAPRVDYFLREVLGVYDHAQASYVYVSDGGHWENLGLVELVRRRCAVILAFDASGDAPYSFAALRSAVDLAWQECRARIALDLTALTPREGRVLPDTNVVRGTVTYEDGSTGVVIFGRLQVAEDSGPDVRAFNQSDTRFPRYATFNLFFRKDQVEHMVLLGQEVAAAAVAAAGPDLESVLAASPDRQLAWP